MAATLGSFVIRKDDEVGIGISVECALDPLDTHHGSRRSGDSVEGCRDALSGPFEEVVDAFEQGNGATSGSQYRFRNKRVSCTAYLPAMVSESSRSNLDPFLTMLQTVSPLVQG